jgi:hypothetical protein
MARYHGNKGMVYLAPTRAGTPTMAVSLTAWSIDAATDLVEVTAFGDPNKVYVQGLKDIKGTIAGWFDDTTDALFDAADSVDGCFLALYPASTAPGIFWSGPAWMSASIDVDVKGAIGISGTFGAAGAWSRASL